MKAAITTLVFSVAALLALGLVMLYSSSMTQVGAGYLIKQLVWCGLGLVACVTMAMVDYVTLRKLVWPIVGATVLLLVLVLIVGRNINGASRWIAVGGFRIQPSEIAKLTLLIMAAWYCDRYQRQMGDWKRGIVYPALLFAPILGLIFIEPDRGTTILMAGVLAVMLLIAGVRWQYFAVPAVLGPVLLGISFWHDPMRMKRILAWLYLEENKDGVGFQAYQAMLALGSGGWTGLGLGNGRQKMGFVPEHHTDFIFSIIGEELGLIGTLGVVLAFVAIIICGIYIALRARDNFGMLLGCGITFLIGFQAFINIGVVTSALPNKGLPLPFISYGGSSLLMMLACIGVLLSIARHARETIATPDAVLAPDNPFAPRTA
jgi:cell division protein FtsW